MSQGVQIGEVARQTGLGIDAIRFYEREGLLRESARTEGGFRLFDRESIRDLKFIRKAQELGFSLVEIRELLVLRRTRPQECSHVRNLLRHKLDLVEEKIRGLLKLEDELKAALRKCNRDLKRAGNKVERHCPVLEELGRSGSEQETEG